jgi:hypothetical protein
MHQIEDRGGSTMRNAWKLMMALLMTASVIKAEDSQLSSRFVSVGLFKNGLAVVKKSVVIPGPGTFRVNDIPEPVHGTFWIESGAGIEARMTSQTVETPIRNNIGNNIQEELVGYEVVIYFRDGAIPPATGKIVTVEPSRGESIWDRAYQSPTYDSFRVASQPSSPRGFLVLDTPEGRTYVDSSMIAYLRAKGSGGTVKQRKPVLLLTVPKTEAKPTEIFYSYLARGASWAPSYRVDISSPDLLAIEQNAVVKNELGDIADAEISLISGFPNIQFAHVTSPFSLRTTWTQFFQQLNQRFSSTNPIGINIARQQAVTVNDIGQGSGLDMSAIPAGEGVDLHYQSLGKRTLAEGDSMVVGTVSGKAPYRRIVEWIVPDTREANGRYIQDYQRQQDPEKYEDAVWDAVRFKNPFSFPMTTAPAMIVSKGRFGGQHLSYWVNPGEETTLHITKALSLRTYHVEHEEPGERDIVYVGGNDFRKTVVKGELKINNHRKEKAMIVIRRCFSGDLMSADGSPTCLLREEGVYSINKRNELTWTVGLNPGEEKTLTYRYTVLVDN